MHQLLRRNILLEKSDDATLYEQEQKKWSVLGVCNCPSKKKKSKVSC